MLYCTVSYVLGVILGARLCAFFYLKATSGASLTLCTLQIHELDPQSGCWIRRGFTSQYDLACRSEIVGTLGLDSSTLAPPPYPCFEVQSCGSWVTSTGCMVTCSKTVVAPNMFLKFRAGPITQFFTKLDICFECLILNLFSNDFLGRLDMSCIFFITVKEGFVA